MARGSKQDNSTAVATSPAPAATPDAVGSLNLDSFFGGSIEADSPAPIIEREHLKAGAVVRHRGTRDVKFKDGRSAKVQAFQLLGAPKGTPWFSLWGSANLNSQLRKVRAGATLLLRYAGQETNPDGSPGAHQWELKPSNASDNVLAQYLRTPERQQAIRELATVVDRAHEADRERRNAQQNGASSPARPFDDIALDDDDLPF